VSDFPQYKQQAVEHLIPYARNARTHSDEQVDKIAASIREFGFLNPVITDGENGIVAGHGRIMAAKKLGMDEVPTVEAAHLTDAQKRAYILADNRLALDAGWDDELLRVEFREIQDAGFDLNLTGFTDDEIAALEPDPEPEEGLTDEDAVPEEPETPVTVEGDVWVLGNHRLMCGDSTSLDAVERLMDRQKASLLHADPPYGMGKEGDGVANDNLYKEKLDAFQMDWWACFRTFLEDNASVYIWGNAPDLWRLWYCGGLSESERVTVRNEIVWNKGGGQGMGSDSFRSYAPATERCLLFMLGEQGFNNNADNYWEGWEPIRQYLESEMQRCGWTKADINRITGTHMAGHWVSKSQWELVGEEHYSKIQAAARELGAFKKDYDQLKEKHQALKKDHDELKQQFYSTRAYFDNSHDIMTDVWDFPRVNGEERHGHATPKPVEMMERVMMTSLPEGGVCVEPFGGSGATLIGAQKTGRTCFTMEMQPQYCDVIIKRWQDFTGKQAIHEETGKTFDEVANA